jgi:DNA-binding NtrC family response regulator
VIVMPTLRARVAEDPAELERLVAHLCARMTRHEDASLAEEVHATITRQLGAHYPFPGNVRELEQSVRRVLLTGETSRTPVRARSEDPLLSAIEAGTLTADALLDAYCARLFAKHQSYVEVARITGLDRRTVKARVDRASERGCQD